MSASILMPRLLRVGAGSLRTLPDALRTIGARRPLLVTDSFMAASGRLEPVLGSLEEASMRAVVYDGAIPDPTTKSLDAGVDLVQASGCDSVVGFGGGSALDSAKAIAVLAKHGGPLSRFKVPALAPPGLPVVAIPTTAGTGSEVTRVAIVTDSSSDEKMLIMGAGLLPEVALVDYTLTMSKPYRLTADSGLDALCHALEAYVSRKASPFTDALALAAAKSVVQHLLTACREPDNCAAREGLMLAATQAGIAFSNASVTLIHGMSRPIGARFHVPHGMSNAILLPGITEYSIQGATERYATAARAIGFAGSHESDVRACRRLVERLHELVDALAVPALSELGIAKADFLSAAPLMAEQALASGSPDNNPIVPSLHECERLYEQVYA